MDQPHGYGAVRFADTRLPSGVRLHYAEKGDNAGDDVILLHGLTDSWFSFSLAMPLLATTHHAWALDQRGHGGSDRPVGGYAVRDFAGDVQDFMTEMALERATLVGHSMGSFVAIETALAAPNRVSRLVLIGSATHARSDATLALQQQFSTLQDPVPEEVAREFQLGTIHHPVPDEFLDRAVGESLRVPARVWRDALAGLLAMDYTHRLRELEMPVLLLRGDHDDIFVRESQEALAEAIRRSTSRTYPATGHALHWERPAEFVRDVEEFLGAAGPR